MEATFVLRDEQSLGDFGEIMRILFRSNPSLRIEVSSVDESWLNDYPTGEAYLAMLNERIANLNEGKNVVVMDEAQLEEFVAARL